MISLPYPFLIPLASLVLCEICKIVWENFKTGKWNDSWFRPGGMPSSHSAFVTSLVIVVGHMTGIESAAFAIAFTLAGITWYDAMSSRHAIGLHAKILNQLQKGTSLSERTGHTFKEVVGGIVFGIVVTGVGLWIA